MPLWSSVFLGLVFANFLFYVEWFWASKLKIALSCSAVIISPILLWVALTAFFYLSSDKFLRIGFIICVILIFSTLFANQIIDLIEEKKNQ